MRFLRRPNVFLPGLILMCIAPFAFAAEDPLGVESTALFREEGGTLKQMALVRLPGDFGEGATVSIEGPGFTVSSKVVSLKKLSIGTLGFDEKLEQELQDKKEGVLLAVPEILQPVKVKVLAADGGRKLRGEFVLEPQRKWEVYVIHATHTDVGYTDIAERVRRQLANDLRNVLAACKQTDDYPPQARFRWVVESFIVLEDFWAEASEAERADLLRYIRDGRIEVTAAYVPHLSDIAGHESYLRFFQSSARFGREHNVPIRSAMFSDATGFAWVVPQVLNSMNIRYLSTAVNPTRSLNIFAELPRPIYWESPDGSRVMVWNSDPLMAYPEGYHLRLAKNYEAALPMVTAYLKHLTETGYRSSVLGLRAAADNVPPSVAISETIRDWNANWKFPHLVFSTNYEFMKTLEERVGPDIPVYRAAWPDWWSDFYLTGAQPTGVLRHAHEWLSAAEKLFAFARLAGKAENHNFRSLEVARQRILMSDEPLWGYAFAVDRPHDWRTEGATSEKINDVYTGAVNARAVANEAGQALFGEWLNARTVVVFNPLGWPRDGVVHVELPRGFGSEISGLAEVRGMKDRATGEEVPVQVHQSDRLGTTLDFVASQVPPVGYAVYELLEKFPSPAAGSPFQISEEMMENQFYRVRVDRERGVVSSIFDKELNRELVDSSATYGFNQYIYERPPEGDFKQVWGGRWWLDTIRDRAWLTPPKVERHPARPGRVRIGRKGPVSYSLILEGSAFLTPLVRQEIILYPTAKRIDIENTIHKQKVIAAEAAYFAFPFAMENPAVSYEGIDTIITPEKGQLPLSDRDKYAVQHWVKLSDGAMDIVWTPIEAPLVEFGGIHTAQYQKELRVTNGSLFSFLLNNYWMTDMQPSQGGEMIFRYSFTSEKHAPDDVRATRFGWNQMAPFVAVGPLGPFVPYLAPPPPASGLPAKKPRESFCEISAPNVLLVSFKVAEIGKGYILRVLEFAGKPTQTEVRLGRMSVASVVPVSAVEQPVVTGADQGVRTANGTIEVALRPFELKTLRVQISQ